MLKATIDGLKYGHQRDLAPLLANLLDRAIAAQWRVALPEHATLIPVPLHPSRERERGFNQSALIAAGIAGVHDGWETDLGALVRTRATPRQVGLSRSERLSNTDGAFVVRWLPPKDHTIILIDDVATTGSTLRECAKTLRSAGARKVWAAVTAQG